MYLARKTESRTCKETKRDANIMEITPKLPEKTLAGKERFAKIRSCGYIGSYLREYIAAQASFSQEKLRLSDVHDVVNLDEVSNQDTSVHNALFCHPSYWGVR